MIDNVFFLWYCKFVIFKGEMSEWFKELVLKTSDFERNQGFESLSLRHYKLIMEKYSSGEETPLLRE